MEGKLIVTRNYVTITLAVTQHWPYTGYAIQRLAPTFFHHDSYFLRLRFSYHIMTSADVVAGVFFVDPQQSQGVHVLPVKRGEGAWLGARLGRVSSADMAVAGEP